MPTLQITPVVSGFTFLGLPTDSRKKGFTAFILVLLLWQKFATRSVAVFLYQLVSRLGLLIHGFEIIRVVLECANCSLHATVGGALTEIVATVSLSTVPRLSLLSRQSYPVLSFASGEADARGRAEL